MDLKDFNSLVLNRQACRGYEKKAVPQEDITEILKTAVLSPSACNSQPWRVYVAASEEKFNEVAEALQENGFNKFTSDAGAMIAIIETSAVLKAGIAAKIPSDKFVKYDIGELVAYITLAAKAKGLDTCVIGWINQEKIRKALDLKDGEECNLVITVGYGNQPLRAKTRKPFEETVKFI